LLHSSDFLAVDLALVFLVFDFDELVDFEFVGIIFPSDYLLMNVLISTFDSIFIILGWEEYLAVTYLSIEFWKLEFKFKID